MSDVTDKVLNRIRKMMRLANDAGATEGERDNALRMAHATLAKYNLDMESLEESPKGESREQQSEDMLGQPWALRVGAAIAKLYFCRYYYLPLKHNGGPNFKHRHYFVGLHSNCAVAREMTRFVVEAIHREAQRYARSESGTTGRHAIYRAFAQGAMAKVYQRVQEIIAASTTPPQDSPGTALVLASFYRTEEDANAAFMSSCGVKLGSARNMNYAGDGAAVTAGIAYGSSLSLRKEIQ